MYNKVIKLSKWTLPMSKEAIANMSTIELKKMVSELILYLWARKPSEEICARTNKIVADVMKTAFECNYENKTNELEEYNYGLGFIKPCDCFFRAGNFNSKEDYQRPFIRSEGYNGEKEATDEVKIPVVNPKFAEAVVKILRRFNQNDCDPLRCSYNKEKEVIDIIDGLHRLLCAIILGYTNLQAYIKINSTVQEDAKDFMKQDQNKTKVSAMDKFMAALVTDEDNVQKSVNNMFKLNKVAITSEAPKDGRTYVKCIGKVMSEGKNSNYNSTNYALKLYKEIWPNVTGEIHHTWFRACAKMYPYQHLTTYKSVVKKMKEFNDPMSFYTWCAEEKDRITGKTGSDRRTEDNVHFVISHMLGV